MSSALQAGPIAIDACSLINLCAANESIEGLFRLGFTFHLSPITQREALYVRVGGTGPNAKVKQPIDLSAAIALRAIVVAPLAGAVEQGLFVLLAGALDDGEAASCALAISRGIPLLSDDAAARRVLASNPYWGTALDTPAIMKYWFDAARIPQPMAGELLRNIVERASFTVPKSNPLKLWWDSTLAS
ncbi:MAG: hypothetical protein ACYC6I_09705 [Bacillota bacterium]